MDPRVFLDEDPTVQAIVEEMVAIRSAQIKAERDQRARDEMRQGL